MSTKEGSLGAPVRHPIDWNNPNFVDEKLLDDELRRVFDICHGCRRCFNLCESFPKLFDYIDDSKSGELDTVSSDKYKDVVDACTLCDMCFLTKCPYVPPHEFNIDFPPATFNPLSIFCQSVESNTSGISIFVTSLETIAFMSFIPSLPT